MNTKTRRPPRASLTHLRARAPRRDRALPALALTRPAQPYADTLFASSLEQLRERCGRHGEAAAAEAQWGAINSWLMNGPAPGELRSSYDVVLTAVSLCQHHDRVRLGYPHTLGRPFDAYLDRLSPDVADEARRVGAETIVDWRRAGSPFMTPKRCKATHQYIISINKQNREAERA